MQYMVYASPLLILREYCIVRDVRMFLYACASRFPPRFPLCATEMIMMGTQYVDVSCVIDYVY